MVSVFVFCAVLKLDDWEEFSGFGSFKKSAVSWIRSHHCCLVKFLLVADPGHFGEIMSIHVVFFGDFTQSLQVKIKWVPTFGADFPIFLDQISPFWIQVLFLGWFPPFGRNWGTSVASVRVAGEECDCSTAGPPRTEADAGTTWMTGPG